MQKLFLFPSRIKGTYNNFSMKMSHVKAKSLTLGKSRFYLRSDGIVKSRLYVSS
jgi:hypothetical protein